MSSPFRSKHHTTPYLRTIATATAKVPTYLPTMADQPLHHTNTATSTAAVHDTTIKWPHLLYLPMLIPLAIIRLLARYSRQFLLGILPSLRKPTLPRIPLPLPLRLCSTLQAGLLLLVRGPALAFALVALLLICLELALALLLLVAFVLRVRGRGWWWPSIHSSHHYLRGTSDRVQEGEEEKDEFLCVCCLEDVALKRDAYVLTPCRHYFHESCFVGWSKRSWSCGRCTQTLPRAG